MEEKKRTLREKIRSAFEAGELFHETEVQANKLGAIVLFSSGVILVIIVILTLLGLFLLTMETIGPPALQGIVEVAILLVISTVVKNDRWWLKYLMIFAMVLVYARMDCMLTHKAWILMVIPVVFSSRYFSRRLTIWTSVITVVIFFFSAIYGATHGMIDVNIVTMPAGTQIIATGGFLGEGVRNAGVSDEMLIRNTLLFNYIPKFFMFSLAAIISCNIARRGRQMVLQQHEKDVMTARIESELNLATRIQANMLPNIFPPFPEREDFDVYATMTPAKEVGGDFYDFFLIDEDHLGLVIADVSGKGVPAALFMMGAKILVQNYAMMGLSPKQVLEAVNERICKSNREEMFVTVWLGVLDLRSGELTAANAGHEYPIVRQPDGSFAVFKDPHGFVIGGMEGIKYKEYTLKLQPGANLFLYTDGVAEASDAEQRQFGLERTLSALNACADRTPEALLRAVDGAVAQFVGDAPQFDDLTMLCVHYSGQQ